VSRIGGFGIDLNVPTHILASNRRGGGGGGGVSLRRRRNPRRGGGQSRINIGGGGELAGILAFIEAGKRRKQQGEQFSEETALLKRDQEIGEKQFNKTFDEGQRQFGLQRADLRNTQITALLNKQVADDIRLKLALYTSANSAYQARVGLKDKYLDMNAEYAKQRQTLKAGRNKRVSELFIQLASEGAQRFKDGRAAAMTEAGAKGLIETAVNPETAKKRALYFANGQSLTLAYERAVRKELGLADMDPTTGLAGNVSFKQKSDAIVARVFGGGITPKEGVDYLMMDPREAMLRAQGKQEGLGHLDSTIIPAGIGAGGAAMGALTLQQYLETGGKGMSKSGIKKAKEMLGAERDSINDSQADAVKEVQEFVDKLYGEGTNISRMQILPSTPAAVGGVGRLIASARGLPRGSRGDKERGVWDDLHLVAQYGPGVIANRDLLSLGAVDSSDMAGLQKTLPKYAKFLSNILLTETTKDLEGQPNLLEAIGFDTSLVGQAHPDKVNIGFARKYLSDRLTSRNNMAHRITAGVESNAEHPQVAQKFWADTTLAEYLRDPKVVDEVARQTTSGVPMPLAVSRTKIYQELVGTISNMPDGPEKREALARIATNEPGLHAAMRTFANPRLHEFRQRSLAIDNIFDPGVKMRAANDLNDEMTAFDLDNYKELFYSDEMKEAASALVNNGTTTELQGVFDLVHKDPFLLIPDTYEQALGRTHDAQNLTGAALARQEEALQERMASLKSIDAGSGSDTQVYDVWRHFVQDG